MTGNEPTDFKATDFKAGWGSEQPGVEGVPAHSREVGTG